MKPKSIARMLTPEQRAELRECHRWDALATEERRHKVMEELGTS